MLVSCDFIEFSELVHSCHSSSGVARLHWCRNPGAMASGVGLAVPEPLQEDDARSWFKHFEVCAAANEWDKRKKLLRLPTLLRGRAWAIFDALPDTDTDTYDNLKKALLDRLSPDTDEDRLSARDALSRRRLGEDRESIDELAGDIEKMLDKASPGLPAEIRDTELRYHLTSALPDKIAFQLKLLPKQDYCQTISYPVPRADGPQQKLANKRVFSKMDLKSAYWQFPMHEESIEKTAFSPGPGYGLWEFTVMPYGLTGAKEVWMRS